MKVVKMSKKIFVFWSFQKAISQSPECGEYYFLLGKLYWDMGEATRNDRSKAHTHFLKVCLIGDWIIAATWVYLVHVLKNVVRFRQQNSTQTLVVPSTTLDVITRRWLAILAGHEAATRKPLTWTLMMLSLGLLQWISVWRTTIWLVDI